MLDLQDTINPWLWSIAEEGFNYEMDKVDPEYSSHSSKVSPGDWPLLFYEVAQATDWFLWSKMLPVDVGTPWYNSSWWIVGP